MQSSLPILTGLSVISSSEKFSPVIVTSVPPKAEPCYGEIPVMIVSVLISRLSSESSLPFLLEVR